MESRGMAAVKRRLNRLPGRRRRWLAEKTRKCYGWISAILSGSGKARFELAIAMGEALGVPASEFTRRYEGPGRVAEIEVVPDYVPGPGRGHRGPDGTHRV